MKIRFHCHWSPSLILQYWATVSQCCSTLLLSWCRKYINKPLKEAGGPSILFLKGWFVVVLGILWLNVWRVLKLVFKNKEDNYWEKFDIHIIIYSRSIGVTFPQGGPVLDSGGFCEVLLDFVGKVKYSPILNYSLHFRGPLNIDATWYTWRLEVQVEP